MQGTIIAIATQSNQGIILGDDGVHYTYTTFGWRDSMAGAAPGMKVDFDVRGSHAVGIYPLPGAAPSPYTNPRAAPGSFQPLPPTYPPGSVHPPATPYTSPQPQAQPRRASFSPAQPQYAPVSRTPSYTQRPASPPEIPLKGSSNGGGLRWGLISIAALFIVAIAGAAFWYLEYGQEPAGFTDVGGPAPPEFIASNSELNNSYERARAILTNPEETEDSRRSKLRVMQGEVGPDMMSLLLKHVPVVDLESGEVSTFDDYMRGTISSYGHSTGSPMDVDPVGAGMRILFDPSPENIGQMSGIGLSDSERQEVFDRYTTDQARSAEAVQQVISSFSETDYDEAIQEVGREVDRAVREFDADRASQEVDRAVQEVSREVDRAIREFDTDQVSHDVDRAVQEASRGVSDAVNSFFGGN